MQTENKKLKFHFTKEKVLQFWKKEYVYILSFGIPAFFMLCVCMIEGIAPFGNRSLIIVDGLHQYMPFFSEYQEKLQNGSSLLYTWDIGLGSNFISLLSYYLSSPLNLIIALFQKEDLNAVVSFLLCLKIAISGLCFSIFLVKKREGKKNPFLVIAFSTGYALNNLVIGYSWNVMWMDAIMILPIIILGLELLIEKKDIRLYTLSLFYALYCNYYISFMICIFVCIWFLISSHKSVWNFIKNGLLFAFSSVLSAAMAAVLLMPAYAGIMKTASAERNLPGWTFYTTMWDILEAHMIGVEPITNQVFDGGVNLYCGILAVFAMLIYLVASKDSVIKRIKYVIVLAFFLLSFNTEILNYIWHGFHNQYGIPNRFAFLYIFCILVMAYEGLRYVHKIDKKKIAIAYFIFLGGIAAIYYLADSKLNIFCYVGSILLLGLYFVLINLNKEAKIRKKWLHQTLSICFIIELLVNAGIGFACTGSINIDNFFDDTAAIEAVKESLDETDDSFYRIDLMRSNMIDEATWHNLRSIGTFGSTTLGSMVTTMGRLGFYTGANEYLYHGATPLTNSILGVKYVLVREGDFNTTSFAYKDTIEGIEVYENQYTLPIGFVVPSQIRDWDIRNGNQFDVQNEFAYLTTGYDNVFQELDLSCNIAGANCSVTSTGDGSNISYTRLESNGVQVSVSFLVGEDMDLYVNCRGSEIKKLRLSVDGVERAYDRYQLQTFHVGEVFAGQTVIITYEMNDGGSTEGTLSFKAAAFQQDVFENMYNVLQENTLQNISYTDNQISAIIDNKEDGVLFTSIPYDTGWTAYVDGEQVDTEAIGEGFLGISLSAGSHEVELRYQVEGLKNGAMITAGAWILFVIVSVVTYKRKSGKVAKE